MITDKIVLNMKARPILASVIKLLYYGINIRVDSRLGLRKCGELVIVVNLEVMEFGGVSSPGPPRGVICYWNFQPYCLISECLIKVCNIIQCRPNKRPQKRSDVGLT